MLINELTSKVIGAAMRVHSALGPGLLESVYETCLEHELLAEGLKVQRQVMLMVNYRDVQIENGFRLDLLVERQLILELKAVDVLLPLHEAQLLTYLRLADLPLGLLINFNVVHLRLGIRRRAYNYWKQKDSFVA